MSKAHRQLLVFTRYPAAGSSKTRLIPELGPDGAAQLHKRMIERLLDEARQAQQQLSFTLHVEYSGCSPAVAREWLGPLSSAEQGAGDLGAKMKTALAAAFRRGVTTAVLVGSDIPGIDAALLCRAFVALEQSPVVLGPARDGGYYLIGLQACSAGRLLPLLFDKMRWSTATVLAKTRDRLEQDGSSPFMLPTLQDIDRPEDVPAAREFGL